MWSRNDLWGAHLSHVGRPYPHTGVGAHPTSRGSAAVPVPRPLRPRNFNGLEFAALVQMNGAFYLRYALARALDEGTAQATVDSTLAEAANQWPVLLHGPQPAAAIWLRLRLNVEEMNRHVAQRNPLVDRLYGSFSSLVADAVVLHRQLHLSVDAAAGVMGVERSTIAGALLTAKRALPSAFDDLKEG